MTKPYIEEISAESLAENPKNKCLSLLGLGADTNPSEEQINRAFRQKSLKNHPDKGGDEEVFKSLGEAREYLIANKIPNPSSASLLDLKPGEFMPRDIKTGGVTVRYSTLVLTKNNGNMFVLNHTTPPMCTVKINRLKRNRYLSSCLDDDQKKAIEEIFFTNANEQLKEKACQKVIEQELKHITSYSHSSETSVRAAGAGTGAAEDSKTSTTPGFLVVEYEGDGTAGKINSRNITKWEDKIGDTITMPNIGKAKILSTHTNETDANTKVENHNRLNATASPNGADAISSIFSCSKGVKLTGSGFLLVKAQDKNEWWITPTRKVGDYIDIIGQARKFRYEMPNGKFCRKVGVLEGVFNDYESANDALKRYNSASPRPSHN